jgi:hypothetical protein
MRKSWLWMATAIGMVVIAGGSVGVLADRILHRDSVAKPEHARTSALWFDCQEQPSPLAEERGREWLERRLVELQQELDLDARQVAELRSTMERHGALAREFWTATRQEYCENRDQLRDDVRALLDEAQQRRFEERLKRIDEQERALYNRSVARDGESRRSKQR